ncbi:MAG: 50S ribosomal protein L29 [Bergeyella sp.]|nr:50S ribosomal protein L29 [Bergeyella sp.]
MKITELKNLSREDLKERLLDVEARYSKLSLAHKVNPIENPIQIRDLRRSIARIKTVIAQQQ